MTDEKIQRVYAARNATDQEAAYDAWSNDYERDLCAMGYRIPGLAAAAFARFVPVGGGPVLDAGCGGGLQAEALSVMGYGPFTGIDLSMGMLDVARAKGIYANLKQQTIGEPLDFDDNTFAATLTTGTFTTGHAPPEGYHEIQRITGPGGHFVMVLRCDVAMSPDYQARLDAIEADGGWQRIFRSDPVPVMPYTEPEVLAHVQVYELF